MVRHDSCTHCMTPIYDTCLCDPDAEVSFDAPPHPIADNNLSVCLISGESRQGAHSSLPQAHKLRVVEQPDWTVPRGFALRRSSTPSPCDRGVLFAGAALPQCDARIRTAVGIDSSALLTVGQLWIRWWAPGGLSRGTTTWMGMHMHAVQGASSWHPCAHSLRDRNTRRIRPPNWVTHTLVNELRLYDAFLENPFRLQA